MGLKFAAIGFAHGHIHGIVPALQKIEGVELAALAEPDEALRADAVSRYGVDAYGDHRELLERDDIDFVAICPANSEKAQLIAECVQHGKHVMADKPLLTTQEGLKLVEEALAGSSAKVSMLLSLRFSATYYTLKQVVARGDVGEVVSIWATRPHKLGIRNRSEAMLNPALNGGVIVDLGIHDMDMVRWVTCDEVDSVTAHHSNHRFREERPDFYDNGHILAKMKRGAIAYVNPDWLTPDASEWHGDCRFFVVGTQGTVETGSVLGEVKLITNTEKLRSVEIERPPVSIYQDFVNQLTDPSYKAILTNHEVIESMRAVLTARDAAERGETVVLEN